MSARAKSLAFARAAPRLVRLNLAPLRRLSSAILLVALAAPGAISGLTSTGSFTFTWNPVAGIAGYAYSFDQNPSGAAGTTVALSPTLPQASATRSSAPQ